MLHICKKQPRQFLHMHNLNTGSCTPCGPLLYRQRASLQRDSGRDEDALNAYLFDLVKAGRVSEAAETCAACGQAWRAASLLGGGPNGPLPLGMLLGCPSPHAVI